jgi:hypothetical protein
MTEPLGQRGALPVTCPTLVDAIVKALRSAGATEVIIAAPVKAGGESRIPHRAKEAALKRRARAKRPPPHRAATKPRRPPMAALQGPPMVFG